MRTSTLMFTAATGFVTHQNNSLAQQSKTHLIVTSHEVGLGRPTPGRGGLCYAQEMDRCYSSGFASGLCV
jgi:hypothetical protein